MRQIRWTFTERCLEINVTSRSFQGRLLYSRLTKLRLIIGGPVHAAEYFTKKINQALYDVGEHELSMTDLKIIASCCSDAHRDLNRFGSAN